MAFDSGIILHVPNFIKGNCVRYGFSQREACDMYLDVDRNFDAYGVPAASPFDKWQVVLEKMQRSRRA